MSKAIIKNPIIFSDIPDVDVLRHGDNYYMVSTTMHVMPGCPIMKSTDLANWYIQSYIYDKIEDNDGYELKNGKYVYGRGQWATSLRYNNGTFYACFVCNDMNQTYIYHTKDIESGDWDRFVLQGKFHDPSILFDDDGRVFIFYNCGDVRITELKPDCSGVLEGGIDQFLFSTPKENIGLRCEGCHAYKINGYYYLIFIEWPTDGNGRRREICYRSKELLGPYERKIVMDDDLGYHNKGVAQGAIFDTPDGQWFSMLFQDHDAVGRIPCILPVKWEDNWPVFGIDGKVPESFESPFEESGKYDIVISDDFNHNENKLALNWQWNHNPDNALWSLSERPGFMRLKTGKVVESIFEARNTLSQRTEGPRCRAAVKLDISAMQAGDRAGLSLYCSEPGTLTVSRETTGTTLSMTDRGAVMEAVPLECEELWLAAECDFTTDTARFSYSLDGEAWQPLGGDFHMIYNLVHFMGNRFAIFNYATEAPGGWVDVDEFCYERID